MGIDLPRDIGTRRLPWPRLGRIIEHLPEESAVARARRAHAPGLAIQFLRRLEHEAALLLWRDSEAQKNGAPPPTPIRLLGDPKPKPKRDAVAVDELLARRQAKRQAELDQLEGGH